MRKFLLFVSFIVLSVSVYAQVPTITSFSPVSVFAGANVTVLGTNLPSSQANCSVFIDGLNAEVLSSSVTQVVFKAPKGKAYGAILIVDKSSRLSGQSTATLVIKNGISGSVSNNILSNTTLAQGQSTIFSSAISSSSARNFDISDLNNDGRVEILASNAHDQLNVFSTNPGNDAVFNFTKQSFVNNTNRNGSSNQVTKALDFTGDGYADILSNIPANSSGVLFPNSGSSTINFLTPVTLATTATWKYNGYNSSFGDLNKDGKPDFIGAYWLSNISIMGINTSTGGVFSHAIGSSNFNSSYSGNVTLVNGAANATIVSDIGIADFNGDGFSDYIVSSSASTFVVLNTTTTVGSSSTSFSQSSDFGFGANNIRMADIDNDGDIDVLVQKNNTNLRVLTNDGSGSFTASTISLNSSGVQLADYDGDGLLDIISYTGSVLNFHKNTSSSSISFDSNPVTIISNQGTTGLTGEFLITDLNSDGKYDVVTASGGTLYVFSAYTPPSLSVSGTLSSFSKCGNVASAAQQLTVSGSDLQANITLAALTGYEYSLNGTTYSSSALSITAVSGSVTNTTVYVRLAASSSGSPSGNLTFSSTGATNQTVAVSGTTGTTPVISVQPSATAFGCQNANFTLAATVTGATSFQWFSNTTNSTTGGTNLGASNNARTSALTPSTSVTGSFYYYLVATSGSCSVTSNVSVFTVDPLPVVGTASGTATICSGTSTPLTLTGSTGTIQWQQSADGTNGWASVTGGSGSTTDSYTTVALTATTYYRAVVSSGSCTAVNSNVITITVTQEPRPFKQALNFDGVNDKVTIPHTSELQLPNTFTLEAWVYVDPSMTSSSRWGIVSKNVWISGGSSTNGLGYGLDIEYGKPRLVIGRNDGAWADAAATSNITTGTWVHVAGTYDGSNARLYINGVLTKTTATSNFWNNNGAALTIGSWPGENKFFKGNIDEVRVWNVTRTASEILQNKDIELAGNETGLVSYYNFNHGTPSGTNSAITTLTDNATTASNGTLNSFGLTGATSNWIAGGPMILNDPSMCINGSATLSHTNTGGTWSTSDANIISIDQSTGIATAVAVGSATITYSYSVNGCPFTSTKVFTVSQTPDAPSATASVNYCRNATATALTATAAAGNTLQWYTVATGGTSSSAPTPSTTTLGSTLYYVSQKTNAAGCEGPRTTITVSINPNTSITTQPTSPSAVCLNANSNTISVTAAGGNLTYQWFTNTANSTTGATSITNATNDGYQVPTNVAGTKFYYVVVSGTCGSSVTSSIVSQVVNVSTFTTEPSSSAQNLEYGGTATALTVVSSGATAYQWYSTPTKPSLLDGFTGTTGFTSSTGAFQTLSGNSGQHPAINAGVLTFAYIDGSSVYRDFNLDQTATTVSFSTEYAETDRDNNKAGDVGKIQLQFFNASNTQVGTTVESPQFTGTLTFQSVSLSSVSIPSGATKVRVIFYQVTETEYWAGNYGIAFRNPSVTTNVALNGTAITGATSATYTPSTSTPGALYYYAVATGGCSTATSALSGLITVGKATPTIGSMAAINKTFGDAAFTLTAPTSNATGAFTYTSDNTAVATVSGATVTIVGVGTANITATQAADANYNTGSVTAVLTVAKAARTLSSFADINKTTTDAPFTLVAPTSSAGTGAVTYASSNTAVATVSGSTVTIVGIGTTTITATQAADANYLAATITATLTVILGDSDGDGVPDDVEIREGTDPNNPSSVKDSDGDGVPDFVEIGNGTNPNSPSDAIDSDGDGLSDYYEARNTAPTNITLSATTVNENNTAGAAIVDITATDVNIGEAFTYSLVSGTGDTDNASFTIDGSSLRAVNSFDFETRTTYSLRLRVTDKGGLSFEKEFVITVADVNEAPTALALSNASVLENAASGTAVGTLAGTDADAGDTHTYTLVSGTGSTDNASFTITGTTLSTAAVFNFEAKNSYAVRVRVTDAGGLSFERAFTISVTDVNEAPTLTAITDRRVYNVSTSQVVNLAGITAGPETAQSTTTTVSTDRPATFSSISVVGTQIQFTLAAGIVTPQDVVVTVRVKDNGGVANGGVDSVVRTFKLGIDPMPVASATPNLITLGATSQLSAAGANAVNYTWVAVGGSGIVGSGATINVRPKGTTTYAVVVTNSFGYQATIPVLLTVIVDYKLVPNNLITPNGDGVNDKWVIPNIDMYPDNEVMVYDKAGRVVFTKRGYNSEWDGTVNGKLLKEDAYFYVIKFNKDGALPIRGYVSIVR